MKNKAETMPIPSGWRFLNENELIRGNFKISCLTSIYSQNTISYSDNGNLELVKCDRVEAKCWYFDTECDGLFYLCSSSHDWVSMFDTKGARSVSVNSIKSFWKVVKKKTMKQNEDGSIGYGNSHQMSAEEIKNEITIHEARIARLKKSLDDLKPKRFDLPSWLRCRSESDGTKQAAVIIGEYQFHAWKGGWVKAHRGFEENDFKLEETTFDKLVVGDWFTTQLDSCYIVGIIEKTESFDIAGVEVFDNGQCRDFSGGFIDEKYYKIVPKN